jgi:hypothetical protein
VGGVARGRQVICCTCGLEPCPLHHRTQVGIGEEYNLGGQPVRVVDIGERYLTLLSRQGRRFDFLVESFALPRWVEPKTTTQPAPTRSTKDLVDEIANCIETCDLEGVELRDYLERILDDMLRSR